MAYVHDIHEISQLICCSTKICMLTAEKSFFYFNPMVILKHLCNDMDQAQIFLDIFLLDFKTID